MHSTLTSNHSILPPIHEFVRGILYLFEGVQRSEPVKVSILPENMPDEAIGPVLLCTQGDSSIAQQLNHDKMPTKITDSNIVEFTFDDPENPLNWSLWRKSLIVILVSLMNALWWVIHSSQLLRYWTDWPSKHYRHHNNRTRCPSDPGRASC